MMSRVDERGLLETSADFANQGAYEIARRYDPLGRRTIGGTPSRPHSRRPVHM
jgi:hypothetical protein